MDVDELDDDDVYAKQLKEVFNSCDLQNKGFLNRNELVDLAQKLQLGEQVSTLLKELLGDDFVDGEVSFEEFRNGFVNVLANAIDCLSEVTEDDQSEWSELDLGENTKDSPTPINLSDVKQQKQNNEEGSQIHPRTSELKGKVCKKNDSDGPSKDLVRAQSLPSTDSGNVDGDTSESVQLRQIWDDLGVGESGYINMMQLSEVCEHLGMEEMDDDAMELLFSELDKDQDGLVSFDEFIEGLFSNPKRPSSCQNSGRASSKTPTNEMVVGHSPKEKPVPESSSSKNGSNKRDSQEPTHKINSKKKKGRSSTTHGYDIFTTLDPTNTGKVKLDDLQEYLKMTKMTDINNTIIKDLKADADGNVKREEVFKHLERAVLESDNLIAISVLQSFKRDMEQLREGLENSTTELGALKTNSDKLHARNKVLVGESEEQIRLCNEENQKNLKKQAKAFAEQFSQKEKELLQQRDAMFEAHQNENERLQEMLDEIKAEDNKTKEKLKEAATEVERLESNLTETVSELTAERKKYSKYKKEAESAKHLKKKIDDLEGQVSFLSELQTKQNNRIRQLEDSNKALHTQNEDYETQIKWLKDEGENGEGNALKRNGSCLSDYMKPQLVKRNERGESLDDVLSENQEINELRNKIFEQENIIVGLRRDLDTVNRMLEEKTLSTNERHGREISRLTDKYASEIAGLQLTVSVERNELLQYHSKEKSELIENFESKIEEFRNNFVNERETLISEHKHERKRLEKQLCNVIDDVENASSLNRNSRKMEKMFKEEKEEIEENHRSETTKLREKIVCLETEKAEMELWFLNQKAELEQQFRIERAELMQNASSSNRECDRSQKYIDFLKDDLTKQHECAMEDLQREHQQDKHRMKEQMDNNAKESNLKHQKHINELTNDFQNQLNVQLTAAATEKSRHLREMQDLKDHLFRANASSNRDNTLKDKVFNDAKAEVMNLNKKLDVKSKKIRALEESLQQMDVKMMDFESDRKNLDEQVQHWKSVVNENKVIARDEKKSLTTKSIRSDTLVTELYVENAELMKQVANAETQHMKAEKQIRQLTDQKRALQRVISKLCNTYGITNLS